MALQARRKSDDSFKPESLQFGLRSLMWFTLAASIYFSQLSIFPGRWGLRYWHSRLDACFVLTVYVSWFALLVFYRHWRLKGAIVAHCCVPGFFLAIGILAIPFAIRDIVTIDFRGILEAAAVLSVCCYVASLCSFPAAALMLVVRGFENAYGQGQRPKNRRRAAAR